MALAEKIGVDGQVEDERGAGVMACSTWKTMQEPLDTFNSGGHNQILYRSV